MNEGKPVPADPAREAGPGPGEGSAGDGEPGGRIAGAPARGEVNAEGDFELERPAPATAPAPVNPGSGGAADAATPGAGGAGGTEQEGSTSGEGGASRQPDADVYGTPADRPQPLHDPDPYGTPPYGQPGPWAPAPPVQHPAATPAHGTAVPPFTTQGAPMPPAQAQAQAQAPVPSAVPDAPAPGMPVPGTAVPAGTAPDLTPAPLAAGVQPAGAADAPTAAAPAPAPAPAPASAYPATPWQNYDPWAAQGPLQQNGAPVVGREQRTRRARKTLVLGAVLIALVAGGVGGAVGVVVERDGGVGDVRLPQAGEEPRGRAPDSVAGIAARALPSVVTLHVKGADTAGTGTGFVLDDRGHILTNNHVVEPAADGGRISVTFNGGETAKATVVGRDSGYDLAVVKVGGVSGLRPMPLGNSDNVQVGDPVVAIGAPFDLAGTVTSGIISAKERPITAGGEKGDGSDVSYVDALQTDAPINPGNSGGPLLDAKGRVVGINSAIRSADSASDQGGQAGSIGLGFAIPVNQAKRVAEELINTGRATHPVIGVTLDMDYSGDGARVGAKGTDGGSAVTRGGPGDKAGIEPGDVITDVDGVRVHSGEELIVRTRAHRPGDRLELTVSRDGRSRTITLVLGSAGGG
ncbi:trypsin-like peptidase domain-containing protein [Streptomyces sp. NPDC007264]|uniref:trypsin-like peptidase domain-containing protein n=1 Tax=Streptomyces sp. NPDC007264 TaxID=3364777 RepID=UPI0036DC0514